MIRVNTNGMCASECRVVRQAVYLVIGLFFHKNRICMETSYLRILLDYIEL